ncbi:MAG: hypothetical protein NC223_12315, partial [Butyrivibrio sp.]|nr:hypothetical protein [Butyrivibrio sp.]
RSHFGDDNFSVICGIIHSEKKAERKKQAQTPIHTQAPMRTQPQAERGEASPSRKRSVVPFVVIGAFIIASLLTFSYFISRADKSGEEPKETVRESGAQTETYTEQTEESTEQTEESAEQTETQTEQTEETAEQTETGAEETVSAQTPILASR